MSGISGTTSGSSAADFELGAHRFATRTSEAIEGLDRSSREKGLVWIFRHALNDEAEARFVDRIRKIQNLNLPIPKIKGYGIESGNAYLITENLGCVKLTSSQADMATKAEYFRDAVRIVRDLHKAGIFLGDICDDSFVVDARTNSVMLVALLGSFELDAKRTTTLPSASVLHYLAPEQRSGMPSNFLSDVFALGILGYRLFTGRYPLGDRVKTDFHPTEDPYAVVPAPSIVAPDAPNWADDVLGGCISLRIDGRFGSAEEIYNTIDEAMTSGQAPMGHGRWSERTLIVRPKSTGVMQRDQRMTDLSKETIQRTKAQEGQAGAERKGGATKSPKSSAKAIYIIGLGIAFGVLAAGVVFGMRGRKPGALIQETFEQPNFVPAELREAVEVSLDESEDAEKRKKALASLATSDNPVSLSVLVSVAKSAHAKEIRPEARVLILQKLKDLGFPRTSDNMAQWMSELEKSGYDPLITPVFSHLMRSADLTLPMNARTDALHRAFADDKTTALRIATSLALDDKEPEHFTPTVRQLLTAAGSSDDLSERSVGAMILGDRVLALYFAKDIVALLRTVTPADLSWSMLKLAENDSPALYDVISETLARNIVPPYQAVFLKILNDADHLQTPRGVKIALVKSARGDVNSADIAQIGLWFDIHYESALLSICALARSRSLAVEALDTLVGRGAATEPAASLLSWLKGSKYWEKRSDFVKAVGILGHSAIANDAEIDHAFDILMPYSVSGQMLKMIIRAGEPRLIKVALNRVAQITPSGDLMKLVTHPDKEVKVAAIKALEGRNEVVTLQEILKAYEREKDPEILAVYRQYHWVVRDRDSGKR